MRNCIIYNYLALFVAIRAEKSGKRLYHGSQFPPGSEHMAMPNILAFSIYLGRMKYTHLALTLEVGIFILDWLAGWI
jgi:hypothetical protein